MAHRLRRLKRIIPALKELLIEQHALLVQKKEQLQRAATYAAKIEELTATRVKMALHITEITATIAALRAEITALTQIITTKQQQIAAQQNSNELTHDAQHTALRQQKTLLEDTLKKHSYSEQSYKQAQEQLKQIELQLTEYEMIQKDVAQQESRKI